MLRNTIIAATFIISSCTAAKLAVPDQFSSQATKMHVTGLNGWMINQELSFGNYKTSRIRRGWDFEGSLQWTKFRISPEEQILRVFNIETHNKSSLKKNKFQYTIEDGNLVAEVYATERFTERELVYKSNNPWIGNASQTKRYEYAFSAAIIPLTVQKSDPWSVVIINKYDRAKDTARRLFDQPFVEEEGYATNGKETIAIRPLRVEHMTTKSGKETKVFGGRYLSGYELRIDNAVVGIIDILDNNVWLYNDLEASEKLILSSVASAIMLKRMQDVAKDKDEIAGAE